MGGSKESITISNDQNRLTPEDIDRMVKEAEQFAEEDKKLKEKVEARNELEGYLYCLKNQVADKEKLGAKLSEEDAETITDAVEKGIEWLEEYKEQKKSVEEIVSPIISGIYQGGEGGGAPGGEDEDEDEDEDDHDEL